MKPFAIPAAHNPVTTRADFETLAVQLLAPLADRYIHAGAGLHLGNTGAHYSSRTATMEGWSRMVWGLAPLLAGGGSYPGLGLHVAGLREGTDPHAAGYWGEVGDMDQRSVEMAAVAPGLLLAPQFFWDPLSAAEKDNLCRWLDGINRHTLAENNWQFFRVLVNVAFLERGRPHNQAMMDQSLAFVDGLSRADGWYVDAVNYDYYVPFALHYYALIYAKYMHNRDPQRCQIYRQKAREFAGQYVSWFRADGSSIPFGRSLTYRFAVVSFFSACAFVDEEVLPWGVMKGLVLRNLRWWLGQPIFDHEGLLTIGFAYPNLVMAEQYNSPTSPYWAFKAFLALALPESHPFWASVEAPLPAAAAVVHQSVPRYVLQHTGQDAVLLCPGNYPPYETVNNAAKYGKFAYSARFGFCVSHSAYGLEKTGGDSMLLLSQGDGYWRERRQTEGLASGPTWVYSLWRPWKGTTVNTWIVASGDWHVRLHRLETDQSLETAEGGFSAPYTTAFAVEDPRSVDEPRRRQLDLLPPLGSARFDGYTGSSLIVGLASPRRGEVVAAEPNLNLITPQVRIPTLRGHHGPGVAWLACAVLAGDAGWVDRHTEVPVLTLEPGVRAVIQYGNSRTEIELA